MLGGSSCSTSAARRPREQDLAAVPEVADPGRLVHRVADVAVAADGRLARVQADPHAHGPSSGHVVRGQSRAGPRPPPRPPPRRSRKTKKNASPWRSISTPPCAANASRSSSLCCREDLAVARRGRGCLSSRVEPSMSEKRKVTVPCGRQVFQSISPFSIRTRYSCGCYFGGRRTNAAQSPRPETLGDRFGVIPDCRATARADDGGSATRQKGTTDHDRTRTSVDPPPRPPRACRGRRRLGRGPRSPLRRGRHGRRGAARRLARHRGTAG